MSRSLTKEQAARAFGVPARIVDRWLQDGCPHSHVRDDLLLFDQDELVGWCAERGFHLRSLTLAAVAKQVAAIVSVEDVDAIVALLPDLVARGAMSRARANALRDFLADVRLDLQDEGGS